MCKWRKSLATVTIIYPPILKERFKEISGRNWVSRCKIFFSSTTRRSVKGPPLFDSLGFLFDTSVNYNVKADWHFSNLNQNVCFWLMFLVCFMKINCSRYLEGKHHWPFPWIQCLICFTCRRSAHIMSYLEIKKIPKFSEREGEEGVLKRQLRGWAQKKIANREGKGKGRRREEESARICARKIYKWVAPQTLILSYGSQVCTF